MGLHFLSVAGSHLDASAASLPLVSISLLMPLRTHAFLTFPSRSIRRATVTTPRGGPERGTVEKSGLGPLADCGALLVHTVPLPWASAPDAPTASNKAIEPRFAKNPPIISRLGRHPRARVGRFSAQGWHRRVCRNSRYRPSHHGRDLPYLRHQFVKLIGIK
jgi:hypothetical protein